MRVVSMVPSWTETLLKAGVEVVGRTRFCIYPAQKVSTIPIVGGTKEVSWDLVMDLKPDLVLLDQEENPLEMAEECPIPYFATHVSSLKSLQLELARLADHLGNEALKDLSLKCLEVIQAPTPQFDLKNIPGFLEWVGAPSKSYDTVAYLIWKKPWMSVSPETYIGSVLQKLGARVAVLAEDEKYPVVDIEELSESYLLFSSEPYPFQKKVQELKELGLEGAIVNGESYSWFGARSIEFLYDALKIKS